jgi:epoxyqueuosine reductase
MRLLLHICCAPCTIHPLAELRRGGFAVHGLFSNPNIHPYTEYRRRAETLEAYAAQVELPVIWGEGYRMEEFLRGVAFREGDRCRYCYHLRLEEAARIARRGKFAAFSTTLLYSRYQKHGLIREICESLARTWDVPFHYADFRAGWDEGVRVSRALGMYRQPYCGCLYSEKDRYFRPRGVQPAGATQAGEAAGGDVQS